MSRFVALSKFRPPTTPAEDAARKRRLADAWRDEEVNGNAIRSRFQVSEAEWNALVRELGPKATRTAMPSFGSIRRAKGVRP